MPSDPSRRRRIKADVAEVLAAPSPDFDLANPFHAALAEATMPELLGLLVAQCRAENLDETFNIEVLIRALPNVSREELLDWNATLQPLGYRRVSALLRRMARHAVSVEPMTAMQRIMARRRDRAQLSEAENRKGA